MKGFILLISALLATNFCLGNWNNPHADSSHANVRYSAITGSPKTLDPAQAYSSNEIEVIAQIYEPILQYHFFDRPYRLLPLTAKHFPVISHTKNKTTYTITIQPGLYYQPHPAFAKNKQGEFLYHHLTPKQINQVRVLSDFPKSGTRELVADDYVYQIKRLASPRLHSPIFGVMSHYFSGFKKLDQQLSKNHSPFLDLRQYSLEGVKATSRYQYQITIKGVYPQFKYWLAMTFFVPIPWEADAFYSQPGLKEHNISLSWYPVGTGPYLLLENNPNKQIVLVANPNYTPSSSRKKPSIEKVILVLDKESIPRWNKFLQGYYDKSGVGADSFDQAIKIDKNGKAVLTQEMQARGIQLQTAVQPGVFYIGFNMLDPVVRGKSQRARLLRRAIAIAINYEEYISIFMNGRGIPAQGPIPPSIFGYVEGKKGYNPYVYNWFQGKPTRKSIAEARALLVRAGYAGGIDPKTKRPLLLNYDVASSGNPDDKAHFSWLREQFAKLGLRLNIRSTLYNRFQEKVRSGHAQIFSWGWMADYPDPENFLFLLYGPNSKVKNGGENAANYTNKKVDALFEEIRLMPNGLLRQKKIDELLEEVRKDSPWIWGFHPISFTLSHQWNKVNPPNPMARNTLKHEQLRPTLRARLRQQWNQPILWPVLAFVFFLFLLVIPLVMAYRRREHRTTIRRRNKKGE